VHAPPLPGAGGRLLGIAASARERAAWLPRCPGPQRRRHTLQSYSFVPPLEPQLDLTADFVGDDVNGHRTKESPEHGLHGLGPPEWSGSVRADPQEDKHSADRTPKLRSKLSVYQDPGLPPPALAVNPVVTIATDGRAHELPPLRLMVEGPCFLLFKGD